MVSMIPICGINDTDTDNWYRWYRYLISLIPIYDIDDTDTDTQYRSYRYRYWYRYTISTPKPIPIAHVNNKFYLILMLTIPITVIHDTDMWYRWDRNMISMIPIRGINDTDTDNWYRWYRYMMSMTPTPIPDIDHADADTDKWYQRHLYPYR